MNKRHAKTTSKVNKWHVKIKPKSKQTACQDHPQKRRPPPNVNKRHVKITPTMNKQHAKITPKSEQTACQDHPGMSRSPPTVITRHVKITPEVNKRHVRIKPTQELDTKMPVGIASPEIPRAGHQKCPSSQLARESTKIVDPDFDHELFRSRAS